MKTIMIVPELPCKNCHKYEPNACVECFNINGKKEQVPENFTELMELCKNLKDTKQRKSVLGRVIIVGNNWFIEDGQIWSYGEDMASCTVAENRTPAQMWAIIKNLIGEE